MQRLAVLMLATIALAACGGSPRHSTARLLNHRLQASLSADVQAGRAVVQPVRDGVRVTLLNQSLFPNGPMALDDTYPDIRSNVIEGMLDPRLMRVAITDTTALPQDQRQTRIQNVEDYLTANGLGGTLQPVQADIPSAPAGLTITIDVRCPKPDGLIGYGSGKSKPVCE